jgi:hypothetical protein
LADVDEENPAVCDREKNKLALGTILEMPGRVVIQRTSSRNRPQWTPEALFDSFLGPTSSKPISETPRTRMFASNTLGEKLRGGAKGLGNIYVGLRRCVSC